VAIDGGDDERAIVVADAKEELARLVLGLIPAHRTVHYIDLGRPEIGFNPLAIEASPGTRASVFLGALIEANPPGAIQARSDDLLRQAVTVVCAVERRPTVWDVYRMLSPGDGAYRQWALARLDAIPGMDFARYYWRREFPELLRDRSRTLEVLDPPLNKLRRLLSTPQVDVVLRHPRSLDIEGAIARGEVIVVNGAKAIAGEDNTRLLFQLLLRLVHRAIQAQQALPEPDRRRVALYVDEAHNVLTPTVATMLAEGRSAGLEACFAWQSAQIRDELVRSGVRSLLQSISIFRMREMEDARSLAGLAMDVYSDRISVDQEEQQRLRFSADDIIHLPAHTAIHIWVARGTPRPAFVASTLPMQELYDPALAEHHLAAQRQDIQLNAWVLAYRRLLGSQLVDWHGEQQITPPRETRQAQPRLDDHWSIEGLHDPHPRPVVPDATLEIRRPSTGRDAAVSARVRPHQPHRQELRQVPPLRRLPRLVVAPHRTRRARRGALRSVHLPARRPARRLPRPRRPRTHRPPLAPLTPRRRARIHRPPTHPLLRRTRRPPRPLHGPPAAPIPVRTPRQARPRRRDPWRTTARPRRRQCGRAGATFGDDLDRRRA
jgi:hypothetical protein